MEKMIAIISGILLSSGSSSSGLSVTSIFMVLALLLLSLALGALMFILIKKYVRILKAKKKSVVITTPAVAISKAQNNGRYGSSYYIAFGLPDGSRKNIRVSVNQYNTILENEAGVLTYEGYEEYIEFVGFKPHSQAR